jgi:alginate O-acetyltransferase complex protein AlgI
MQPSSLYFAIFLGVVTVLYFFTPFRFRWLVLLAASCYFYLTWSPEYILFITVSILINFYLGLQIERSTLPGNRKIYLIIGLAINLLALIYFKYTLFLAQQIAVVLSWFNSLLAFPLPRIPPPPVGISFYTFQVIAYLLDINTGLQKSETRIGKFALFTTFFPLQISGPIERAKNLLPQFSRPTAFLDSETALGLKRMAWGVFKKIVIADRLAIFVDQVFNHPKDFNGFPVILAVIFFAFQLYCDFSGYTDIVLGAARILGYQLSENFNKPYFASSIQNFWNSWHISLSSWVRDYIFFPLRRRLLRQRSLPQWVTQISPPLITMLVIGIWHGANWTFVVWGLLHGSYLVVENRFRPRLDAHFMQPGSRIVSNLYSLFQTGFTFALVCFGWVFFRANSIGEALVLLGNITRLNISYYFSAIRALDLTGVLKPFVFDGGLDQNNLLLSIFLIVFLLSMEALSGRTNLNKSIDHLPTVLRWGFYVLAIFTIIFLSADVGTRNFIYFRF